MRERTLVNNSPAAHPSTIGRSYSGTCANPWFVSVGPTTYYTTVNPRNETIVTHDVVTPNFTRRRNAGEIINNPYDSTRTLETDVEWPMQYSLLKKILDCPGGVGRIVGSTQIGWASSKYLCKKHNTSLQLIDYQAPQPEIDVEALKSLAVTEAYAKADASEAAVLCTLAEAKESVHGILYILQRAMKIKRMVKKLDAIAEMRGAISSKNRTLQALRKEISSKELQARYMEARYSIRPLIYDAKQIFDALMNNSSVGTKLRQTYRGKMVGMATVTEEVDGRVTNPFKTKLGAMSRRNVECRAGVLTDTQITMVGLWGLDQPVEALWEIIPFSFIWDWFFNIGRVIAAMTPNVGVKRLASWVVTKDVTTYETWVEDSWIDPTYLADYQHSRVYSVEGAHYEKMTQLTTREVDVFGKISIRANIRLNLPKLLDLAIILKQFAKR